MSKQNIKDYNHRFDLNIEVKPVEGEKNKFEFIITPNEKRYDFRVFNGIEGYFDKYDNIFIPKDVLINSLNQMLGLQINIPLVFSFINDSNLSKEGRANPSSIEEGIVRMTAPADIAKAM